MNDREYRLNLKKSFHHEGHEDHEVFSNSCVIFYDRPEGESFSGSNFKFFFAYFVLFVVQLQFKG